MKNTTQIVLFVLFLGGLLAYWYADYRGIPGARERLRKAGLVLPDLSGTAPGEIHRVEVLDTEGRLALAFERRGSDRWQMTTPIDALADRSRVEALVTNLKDLRRARDAGTIQGDPATFGLRPPSLTIRLLGEDRRTPLAVLAVGKTVGENRYVHAEGAEGFEVVPARVLGPLDLPAEQWREKGLFPLATFEIQAVDVRGPGRRLAVERAAGRWRITAPFRAPAEASKVEGLLADLTALRVSEGGRGFVANDVKDFSPYGLDDPTLTVEVVSKDAPKTPLVAQFGNAVPGEPGLVYARRADQDDVVAVDGKVLLNLGTDPVALRSRKIAEIDLGRIDFLRIEAGGARYELARYGPTWAVLKPQRGPADDQTMRRLLDRLGNLPVVDVADLSQVAGPGFDQPVMVLQAWQDGLPTGAEAASKSEAIEPHGEPSLTLRLGRTDQRRRVIYAQVEGDRSVLALPIEAADLIPQGPLAYRSLSILTLSPTSIARLSRTLDGQRIVLTAPRTPGDFAHWRLVEPVDTPADPVAIPKLVTLLSGLRAERLITEEAQDLRPYGLDAPSLTITWSLRPEARPRENAQAPREGTLQIGAELKDHPGSRYAQVAGQPLVFSLGALALDILQAELHDHHIFTFAIDQANRLVLRWPGWTLALARRDDQWQPEPGSDLAGLDPKRFESLLSLLAKLETPRFVQYEGPIPPQAGLSEPRLTVEVGLSGGGGTRVLRIGAQQSDAHRYATADLGTSGAVFLLPSGPWDPWLNLVGTPRELPRDLFAR